ncbi:ABC transporter substrate-binding protein [Thiocystis violacea]|uniref:ABC transporter substrate-binding protein n=1 Tax=Thiocystis violacea TaxID=13725 RepID=UPI001903D5BD|nr:ABC transporter substrate-binding protein [Thiocystis violacea]MBK1722750.1 ABC transporter substrate-binding protein [Thiocystis violacea]
MLAVLALWSASAPAASPLPTLVSTDLCSDLLLLSLAAPEQILSLSRQSRNPQVSPVAQAASAYPTNRGGVEDLLYRKPEIALVYLGWTARRHADLLAGQGTRVISLPYPRTWSDALASARQISIEIGREAQGEAKAADAEQRMRRLGARSRPYRVLYLRPNGGTAGKGTYVDDVLSQLGLRNLATEQGLSGWGRYPLERLVSEPPDIFLLGYFDQSRSLARSAYGRHPLFRAILERTPSIRVPTNAWGCGGLELVEAAEQIAAQIDGLALGVNAQPARHDD